ncbi:EutN/CcmL family microcompartment protein [Blastopirellula retiformator]|uniref:Ethanolamine utilization protein EutN n=1 Tax=Blastopirellula retiformator TaxID=2527970 RepID=A0A5C5UVW3_9BACT|nr:EutN/CcmL family microcompartment protein [Blastopirellula retiformator]TWT29999.1 Ethanolamine utilization protein EutN [Blastopirellula retiformator]
MNLAKVVGTATSTVKHPSMQGWKLLVVQPQMADGETPDGYPLLAVDAVGAGPGETVMITSDGQATRELLGFPKTPVRWTVIGIADE